MNQDTSGKQVGRMLFPGFQKKYKTYADDLSIKGVLSAQGGILTTGSPLV